MGRQKSYLIRSSVTAFSEVLSPEDLRKYVEYWVMGKLTSSKQIIHVLAPGARLLPHNQSVITSSDLYHWISRSSSIRSNSVSKVTAITN